MRRETLGFRTPCAEALFARDRLLLFTLAVGDPNFDEVIVSRFGERMGETEKKLRYTMIRTDRENYREKEIPVSVAEILRSPVCESRSRHSYPRSEVQYHVQRQVVQIQQREESRDPEPGGKGK